MSLEKVLFPAHVPRAPGRWLPHPCGQAGAGRGVSARFQPFWGQPSRAAARGAPSRPRGRVLGAGPGGQRGAPAAAPPSPPPRAIRPAAARPLGRRSGRSGSRADRSGPAGERAPAPAGRGAAGRAEGARGRQSGPRTPARRGVGVGARLRLRRLPPAGAAPRRRGGCGPGRLQPGPALGPPFPVSGAGRGATPTPLPAACPRSRFLQPELGVGLLRCHPPSGTAGKTLAQTGPQRRNWGPIHSPDGRLRPH